MAGKVFLVGAGPGDPGLMTVKGLRCLGQAQVVVYDRLMDPSLLEAAPETAERVFVGKERGRQALTQDQINQLLGSLQKRALEISAVAEELGRNAGEVSISVTDIARLSGETVDAIERSDQASGHIGELLETLQGKASQFRV